jgi:hypothetical protein
MGLDQTLYARTYVSSWSHSEPEAKVAYNAILGALGLEKADTDPDHPIMYAWVPVMYWRKAYQIDQWFTDNVFINDNNTDVAFVDRGQLEELLALCEVIAKSKSETISADLLPDNKRDYDEWYYEQIEYTERQIRAILANEKLAKFEFYYESSW